MILSFHPIFEGDRNIICAGRDPGPEELSAIRAADAVILPQGCRQSLYKAARENCCHIFPNYDIKFSYPGKIGQTLLFQEKNAPHPKTETYSNLNNFCRPSAFKFPFVFKFDRGGEGEGVFLIRTESEFQNALHQAARFEAAGHKGFLLQEYIASENGTLRVAVIGEKMISYWRVPKNTESFYANLSKGAVIDNDSAPDLQAKAIEAASDFCRKTGINLAGFDFLFPRNAASEHEAGTPLFLEINYFFGRQGLGGSEKFYELLVTEIKRWIKSLSQKRLSRVWMRRS
jgi:ribosomal protein S6--L-glutamate ligase